MNKLYIWQNRALYLGQLPDTGEHRLGAAALCLGIDQPFRVQEMGVSGWRICRSVLIPPGCDHAVGSDGVNLAILFLDPASTAYAYLIGQMTDGSGDCRYQLANEAEALAVMQQLQHDDHPVASAERLLDRLLDPTRSVTDSPAPVDARIARVMELITADVSHSYPVAALARQVSLSSTRLIHLFKDHAGVPIRRFRQWQRMRAVVANVAAGGNLTTAALDAGFSDSAHFSRAFRAMFGLKPSFVFNRAADLIILIG